MTSSLRQVWDEILESSRLYIEHVSPSEWYEKNMVMPRGSAFPGPFSYDLTPFWREPLDCIAKDHHAKEITIMKGAQLGGTVAVLNPIVGYTISQNPGNIMFLTGHSELQQASFLKLDQMIDNCGIRRLIKPTVVRAKNSRSGDTDKLKEFPGGSLWGGSVTNHNLLRQYDVMIMLVDDFDAARKSEKKTGATRELVQKRTSAYAHKKKIIYVSSPQLKNNSNIEDCFECGDQRYWNVPCPCCGEFIVLKWNIPLENGEAAGITWKLDDKGHLIRSSVGYVCQKCAGFFTDQHKYEMNMAGMWVPTVVAREEYHYSYQISSLYAPPGMDDWASYVQQYINATSEAGRIDQSKLQTFTNVVLGETFVKSGKEIKANALQKNVRTYSVGIVPEGLAKRDGAGKTVMLTCACDLNGLEDDARLDWEVVAWTENAQSYSVKHGSIGTFVPKENKEKAPDREKWSYNHSNPRNVWGELNKILGSEWMTDENRKMRILITGVDTGYQENHATTFIDKTNFNVFGLKGDKEGSLKRLGYDVPLFKHGKSHTRLFLLDVNTIKDQVSNCIDLKWTPGEEQPPGFMNFPSPEKGLYGYNNFFSHFEAEHRVPEYKDGTEVGSRWVKKQSHLQNHHFDVYIYNYVLKEIWAEQTLKAATPPTKGNWFDFVAYMKMNKML